MPKHANRKFWQSHQEGKTECNVGAVEAHDVAIEVVALDIIAGSRKMPRVIASKIW